MFFASILELHAYFPTVDDTFRDSVAANLGLSALTRLHVNDGEAKWIDVYTTTTGRQVWVLPGTINKREWLAYAVPVMRSVGAGGAALTCYNGLAQQCNLYGDYAVANLADRVEAGKGAITIIGHSSGGVAAQYLAYRMNALYKVAHPSGTDYPVGQVISFGSPVAFNADDLGSDFMQGWQHFRCYNPGDPVPLAAFYAYKIGQYAGRPLSTGDDYRGPRPYDTRHYSVQPNWAALDESLLADRLNMLDGKSFSSMRLLIRGVTNTNELVMRGEFDTSSHAAATYANRLEIVCRDRRETPYPRFTFLVQLNRYAILKTLGLV